jgi:GTP cyclohydrolase I
LDLDQADRHPATEHARAMLAMLGIDTSGEATSRTPARFVRALAELTAGAALDPDRHLTVTFPPPSDDPGMVIVPGIPFTSVCEHHLLAFTGTAAVAYLPASRIVGLSKLARLTQEYAARPQVQERLGDQIADALMRCLDARGAAVLLRASHSCMTLRGARAAGAVTVTSHLRGAFRTDAAARAELLALAGTDQR